MGLCQHVYRRGALYWWRRRFAINGCSQTIAISLRVREPRAARRLGAALKVKAYEIANQIGSGMTIDGAQKDLILVVDGATWRLSESALASLDSRQLRAATGQTLMSRDQQIPVLRALTSDAEVEIAFGTKADRFRAVVDSAGRPFDPEKAGLHDGPVGKFGYEK